jgi:uncharacterized protein
MPSYKRPGVYFEESIAPAEAVTSTSLSAGAFLAANPRGPVTAQRVTSWTQYLTYFGGFFGINDFLPYAVFEFFSNGGREAYVARVAGSGASAATTTLKDRAGAVNEKQAVTITGSPAGGTFTLTFEDQTTAGIAYNAANAAVVSALEALSNIAPGEVLVTGGPLPDTAIQVEFTGTLGGANRTQMTANAAGLTGGTSPAIAVTTTEDGSASGRNTLKIDAANPGVWGNSIYVDVIDVSPDRYSLVVKLGGAGDAYVVERWLDLSMNPTDGRYALSLVNGTSPYITLTDLSSSSTAPADRPLTQAGTALTTGSDGGTAAAGDIGAALTAFDSVEVPLTLNLPGHTGAAVGSALTYAAGRGDVFVVVDPPQGNDVSTVISSYVAGLGASSYGAVYYPWVQVADPASAAPGASRLIPPGGAVVGQYAATDATRGVFKTPAGINTRIGGAVGVERKLTGTELDSLNMANVNAIRHLPGAGVVIMGGRTLKLSGSDKYVSVRRTLIYIRSSLINSTRFAIFEPNDERLWLVLRSIIERFLLDLWQQGGLRGNTAAEAFFVKCDDELNTPQGVAAGEVKVQIGVALQYPAEFVVFTLSQREVGATVTIQA